MSKLIRAISENGGVIIYAAETTDVAAAAEQIHKTSAVTTAALGRLLTAGCLMAATLKSSRDSLTLRVKGNGPAGNLVVVADGSGHVKGEVTHPVVEIPLRADGKLDVGGAVGHSGTLTVIKDMGLKEPYVGQVPLVSGEIAEDITSYYASSEQIPNVCALGVLVNTDLTVAAAGGYMIQLLPGASEEEISQLEKNIAEMPSVTALLHSGKTIEDIVQTAMKGFAPEILDETQLQYYCGCSAQRVQRILASLGEEELEKMMEEDPVAEVCCHFCGKVYREKIAPILQQVRNKKKA